MTFDEAIEELRLAIPEKFYSPTMHDIAVMLEAQNKVINLLRQEYAPTVEMTQEQVNVIYSFKKDFSASYLPEVIHNQPEGDWSFLDELSGKLFGHRQGGMTDKNIEDIMKVWLHPETIKVVDL